MEYRGVALVTGAAGFMGSHLVEHLAVRGVKVRASSRPRADLSFFQKLGVEYIPADMTKPETLPPLFEGDVDRVFHLGAICNFSTPLEKLIATNVTGVDHMTRLALAAGVKRFIHVTSTSVYGQGRGRPFTEESPRAPQDAYATSKSLGEDVVFGRIQEGLPAVIVRPCTVYGPRCRDGAGKVFSRPSSITGIPGNGRQRLSNVRAEDVAAAVLHLSLLDEAVGQVYNLADDSHPTLEEALVLAAKTYGGQPPGFHLPLGVVKMASLVDGFISRMKGRLPEIERDAVNYLYSDYIVDNGKIKKSGYKFIYPDFEKSMGQLGELYRSEKGRKQ